MRLTAIWSFVVLTSVANARAHPYLAYENYNVLLPRGGGGGAGGGVKGKVVSIVVSPPARQVLAQAANRVVNMGGIHPAAAHVPATDPVVPGLNIAGYQRMPVATHTQTGGQAQMNIQQGNKYLAEQCRMPAGLQTEQFHTIRRMASEANHMMLKQYLAPLVAKIPIQEIESWMSNLASCLPGPAAAVVQNWISSAQYNIQHFAGTLPQQQRQIFHQNLLKTLRTNVQQTATGNENGSEDGTVAEKETDQANELATTPTDQVTKSEIEACANKALPRTPGVSNPKVTVEFKVSQATRNQLQKKIEALVKKYTPEAGKGVLHSGAGSYTPYSTTGTLQSTEMNAPLVAAHLGLLTVEALLEKAKANGDPEMKGISDTYTIRKSEFVKKNLGTAHDMEWFWAQLSRVWARAITARGQSVYIFTGTEMRPGSAYMCWEKPEVEKNGAKVIHLPGDGKRAESLLQATEQHHGTFQN